MFGFLPSSVIASTLYLIHSRIKLRMCLSQSEIFSTNIYYMVELNASCGRACPIPFPLSPFICPEFAFLKRKSSCISSEQYFRWVKGNKALSSDVFEATYWICFKSLTDIINCSKRISKTCLNHSYRVMHHKWDFETHL